MFNINEKSASLTFPATPEQFNSPTLNCHSPPVQLPMFPSAAIILPNNIGTRKHLQLSFESERLRSICENEDLAKADLGGSIAGTLKRRLADLLAAKSIYELPAGNPRPNQDDPKCQIIDLAETSYLFLQPNHPKNPLTEGGDIDWGRVTRVKVTRIGRCYE